MSDDAKTVEQKREESKKIIGAFATSLRQSAHRLEGEAIDLANFSTSFRLIEMVMAKPACPAEIEAFREYKLFFTTLIAQREAESKNARAVIDRLEELQAKANAELAR